MRSCSNCKYRMFSSWDWIESCLDYEMATTEAECEAAAKDCPRYEEGTPSCLERDEYTPSATNGDYSPSSPWNAPGMSVSDFI